MLSNITIPQDGDYVVSIIDNLANIKKIHFDRMNSRIILYSESSSRIEPILIHQDDDFMINGKVVDVIKNPK